METKSIDTKEELRQTIMARRHARGDCDIKPEFREPEIMELTPAEREKKERRREQNRRAAQRCRSKKRQSQNKVLQNFEKILENNKDLRNEMQALKQERDDLIKTWHKHKRTCPVLCHASSDLNGLVKKEPSPEDLNSVPVKRELISLPVNGDTVLKVSNVNTNITSYAYSCPSNNMLPDVRGAYSSYCAKDAENSPMLPMSGEMSYDMANPWFNQQQCMNYPNKDQNTLDPNNPHFHQRQFHESQRQAPYSTFLQSPPYPTQVQYQRERSKTYPGLNTPACNPAVIGIPPQQIHTFPHIPPQPQDPQHHDKQPFVQSQQQFGLSQQQQQQQQQFCGQPPPPTTSVSIDKSIASDPNNKYPDILRLLQSPCQTAPSTCAGTALANSSGSSNSSSISSNKSMFNAPVSTTFLTNNSNIMQITPNESGVQGRPRPNSNGALDKMKSEISHNSKIKGIADGLPRPRSQSGDSARHPSCRFVGGTRPRQASVSCSISLDEPTHRIDGSRMSSVSSDAGSLPDSVTSIHRDDRLGEVTEADADDVFTLKSLHDFNSEEAESSPMASYSYDLNNNDNHLFDSPGSDDARSGNGGGYTNIGSDAVMAEASVEISSFAPLASENEGDSGPNHVTRGGDSLCNPYFEPMDALFEISPQDLIFYSNQQFGQINSNPNAVNGTNYLKQL